MLADGLVDECHLFVHPTTRGAGLRLFTEDTLPGGYALAASESYGNGVVHLSDRPAP
jgi:riboflavin biosynthesis pyrimidine reductase